MWAAFAVNHTGTEWTQFIAEIIYIQRKTKLAGISLIKTARASAARAKAKAEEK